MNDSNNNVSQDDSIIGKFSDDENYSEEPIEVVSFDADEGKEKEEEEKENIYIKRQNRAIGVVLLVLAILSLLGARSAYENAEDIIDSIYGASHLVMAAIFIVGGFLFIRK